MTGSWTQEPDNWVSLSAKFGLCSVDEDLLKCKIVNTGSNPRTKYIIKLLKLQILWKNDKQLYYDFLKITSNFYTKLEIYFKTFHSNIANIKLQSQHGLRIGFKVKEFSFTFIINFLCNNYSFKFGDHEKLHESNVRQKNHRRNHWGECKTKVDM